MPKAVYSLVLQSDVVDAVDRLAYLRGTSRSALINQILAEAVGYVTPEHRMAEILDTLSNQMTGLYQLQEQGTDGTLIIRSPLRYRYKPTIRYRVELYRQPDQAIGVLHASFRTQNQNLLQEAEQFFRCWSAHETAAGAAAPSDSSTMNGSWDRQFRIRGTETRSNAEIGAAIGQYIKRVDAALKAYFAELPDREAAKNAVSQFFT
ncbi:MAG: ribbon-helix-helix domain-containing protein [Oscillospiraceae bacterium]|nr:ribbon-helix-helix domain-containing protein [Oscillospiraceae bacterium]